jgi:hypothetical protein
MYRVSTGIEFLKVLGNLLSRRNLKSVLLHSLFECSTIIGGLSCTFFVEFVCLKS